MQTGNVIIADGKVGVVSDLSDGWMSCSYGKIRGIYLDGVDFSVLEDKCVLLDECLNDYINRHVRKFGKLKVSSRGKNGKSNG